MQCTITNGIESERDWKCDGETKNASGVCDSCKAAGWTADPGEIAAAIASDPLLRDKIGIVAPIQPDDPHH